MSTLVCVRKLKRFLFPLVLPLLLIPAAQATPAQGHLSGLLLDSSGHPLSNVLVSLLQDSALETLPTLARTNESGRIHIRDLETGTYQVLIKSSQYRNPVGRVINILPGRTVIVTLILQQLIDIGAAAEDNQSVKTVLRSTGDERLILRHLPEFGGDLSSEESSKPLFQEAALQVYTNAGPGSDYLVFPAESWGGTTTNFAMVDSIGANTEHVFAGQLNSGQDSLWRLNNLINHQWHNQHTLQVLFGYGRMSFAQPSLAAMDNPSVLQGDHEYTSAPGIAKLLSFGVMDSFQINPSFSLNLGVELNQISGGGSQVFVSPNAELEYALTSRAMLRLTMTSKRSTLGNTLTLPNGNSVNLASPLYLSRVNDQLNYGTSQYYQGSFSHALGNDSEIELALFDNRIFGGAVPVLAVLEYASSPELLNLGDGHLRSRGYRATMRRIISEEVRAEFSYILGAAAGLGSGSPEDVSYNLIWDAVRTQPYQAVSTQLQVFVPVSQTHITALLKFVPVGTPLMNVDSLSDFYETGNEGVNLFIRQVIPLPVGVLNLFGLDFLTLQRVEALLDIRNLTNTHLARRLTPEGSLALLQNPRSVRGGIAVRF
jgi:hypothetical protein